MAAVGFSQTQQQSLLNAFFAKATFTAPTAYYVALLTTMPTDDVGTGIVETTYTGYARQQVTSANWASATAAQPSVVSNTPAVTFGVCTAGSGTIVGFALYDAVSAGTYLGSGTLTSNLAVSTNVQPAFASGQLQFRLD